MIALWIVIAVAYLALIFYFYGSRNFDYWKKRGVIYLEPKPLIGNLGPLIQLKYSLGEYLGKIYDDYKEEPYVGIFLANSPCLVLRDYDLIMRVLKQDFNHFNRRILIISKKTDLIGSRSLFTIHGKEWKNARTRLLHIFTSDKQRVVFKSMLEVGERFANLMKEGISIDASELSRSYSIDIISDSVFKLRGTAMENPKQDTLRRLGNCLFSEEFSKVTRLNVAFLAPEIMEAFNVSLFSSWAYKTIRETLEKALELKKMNNENVGDYIDAFLDLQARGSLEGNNGEIIEPDDDNLAAQFFMFFTAGFESTSSGVLYNLYELARNQDIQNKLRNEYNEAISKNGGVLTYEILNGMTYLDNFVNEVLRKYPPFPFIDRVCTTEYKVPGTGLIIEKGTKILIPLLGLQRDAKFYENPELIIPERFNNPKVVKTKPFLPFGDGPRTCLGVKFSLQMLKIVVISALKDYNITVSKTLPEDMKIAPKRFGLGPRCNVILDVHKIINNS